MTDSEFVQGLSEVSTFSYEDDQLYTSVSTIKKLLTDTRNDLGEKNMWGMRAPTVLILDKVKHVCTYSTRSL